MNASELQQRKEIAVQLLSEGIEPTDLALEVDAAALPAEAFLTADLAIPFPAGLAPVPQPLPATPDPGDPLPDADVVVVTWTVAEQNALADVLTPGFNRNNWYRYNRRFETHYQNEIRPTAPAMKARRLGSWFLTRVGGLRVLCFKSELHLNQDSMPTGDGTATLPVKRMFGQLIEETQCSHILTVGTSGGVDLDQDLGDVVVTRAAKFRLADEFKNEDFNGKTYKSDWQIPTKHFAKAVDLMSRFANRLAEPAFAPPTKRYAFPGPPLQPQPNTPDIKLDGTGGMPEFHPILTTDFFEFGSSANHLGAEGCAVEMGDAVLGLLCEEMAGPPRWAVVRNISDPQINADLPTGAGGLNMQTHWAVWYYEQYGYWTSVTGALATWGILAGIADP